MGETVNEISKQKDQRKNALDIGLTKSLFLILREICTFFTIVNLTEVMPG